MSPPWLVNLPLAAQTRIAEFISGGEQTPALLHFAELHPSLHKPVFAALRNELKISDGNYNGVDEVDVAKGPDLTEAKQWARICPSTVDQLVFTSPLPTPTDDGLGGLLAGIKVNRVDMTSCFLADPGYGEEGLYEYVAKCQSVNRLDLFVAGTRSEGDIEHVWQCLQTLELEALRLECGCIAQDEEERLCVFREEWFNEGCNKLGQLCENLQMLEVSQCAFERLQMIRGELSKLEKVIVHVDATFNPDDCLGGASKEDLPANTFVTFNTTEEYDLMQILSLGDKLLRLHTSATLEPKHMQMLATCVNLEALDAWIENGIDRELASAIAKMSSLTSVALQWGRVNVDRRKFARLEPPAVLEIARARKSLTELHLQSVRVSLAEWEQILRSVGGRLQMLGASVTRQEERELERWERMLLLMARYCCRLRSFAFVDGAASERVWKHERVKRAKEMLERRCPCVVEN